MELNQIDSMLNTIKNLEQVKSLTALKNLIYDELGLSWEATDEILYIFSKDPSKKPPNSL